MPIYISQGCYTRDAVKGMLAKPEDRAREVTRLLASVGGKLHGHYLTFGEYDFLVIAEAPNERAMASALLAVASGGGVSNLRTTVAMPSAQAKGVYRKAAGIAKSFRSAGGVK